MPTPNAAPVVRANKLWFALCLGLVIVANCLLQFWLRQRGLYSISADESGRTLVAYRWMRGELSLVNIWLPFHTVLTAAALHWWPDLFWMPRWMSSVFGLFSLGGLLWLAQELFRCQRVTVVTGVLASCFAPLLILSVVPLAEVMFISVIVAACACFVRAERTGSTRADRLGVLCLALSTAIRYEGWAWAVAFILWAIVAGHLWGQGLKANVIGAALLLATFPISWIGAHTLVNGDPIGFLRGTAERYRLMQGDSWTRLLRNSLGYQFIEQNLLTLNLLGIGGCILYWRRGSGVWRWALTPVTALVIMAVLSIAGLGMPSHNFWRIAVPWSVLLLPFTAYGLVFSVAMLPLRAAWRGVVLATTIAVFATLMLKPIRPFLDQPTFLPADLAAGQWLRGHLSMTAPGHGPPRILLDTSRWSYLNVMVAAQDTGHFIYNAGFDPIQPKAAIISATGIDEQALVGKQVTHALLVGDEQKDRIAQDRRFRKLQDFGPWSLYAFVP